MTIGEIIRQGFHYARNCRSLWLFGFFVGVVSGGSNGGVSTGDRPGGDSAMGGWPPFGLSAAEITAIAIAIVLAALAAIVLRFISEGTRIEALLNAGGGPS